MAIVRGYTAEHMQEIEDTCIVQGAIDLNGRLQLIQRDGAQIDAGIVRDVQGISEYETRLDAYQSALDGKLDKTSGTATDLRADTINKNGASLAFGDPTAAGDQIISFRGSGTAVDIGPDGGSDEQTSLRLLRTRPTGTERILLYSTATADALNNPQLGIQVQSKAQLDGTGDFVAVGGTVYITGRADGTEISAPRLILTNFVNAGPGTTNHALQVGPSNQYHLIFGDNNIEALDGTSLPTPLILQENSDALVRVGSTTRTTPTNGLIVGNSNGSFTKTNGAANAVATKAYVDEVVTTTGSLTAVSPNTSAASYKAYRDNRTVMIRITVTVASGGWAITGTNFTIATGIPAALRPMDAIGVTQLSTGNADGYINDAGAIVISNNNQTQASGDIMDFTATYVAQG